MHFFGLQHGHRNHYACCHLESEQNWHLLQCRIKCHCIHFEMLQVCLFAAPSSIPDLSTLPSLGCVVASVLRILYKVGAKQPTSTYFIVRPLLTLNQFNIK